MQKIVLLSISILLFGSIQAQDNGKISRKLNLNNRPGDHLMIQFSSDHLSAMPDSISSHQKGFSKGFNASIAASTLSSKTKA